MYIYIYIYIFIDILYDIFILSYLSYFSSLPFRFTTKARFLKLSAIMDFTSEFYAKKHVACTSFQSSTSLGVRRSKRKFFIY